MKLSNFNQIFTFGLFLILGVGLTGCYPENSTNTNSNISSKQANPEKQQRWQAMEKEIDSITDGLGLGIDPGIKTTVIVLNLLGFKTSQSCEGHIGRGLPYPWIDFETENQEIADLNTKHQNIIKLIEKERSDIQKKYPDLSLGEALRKEESKDLNSLYQKMHTINDAIEKISKSQLMPLKKLLGDFYKGRTTDPDRMITIHELNPTFLRMYSLGGNWQIVRSDNDKASKLKEYQQEMKKFTNFLTDQYFSK